MGMFGGDAPTPPPIPVPPPAATPPTAANSQVKANGQNTRAKAAAAAQKTGQDTAALDTSGRATSSLLGGN